MNRSLALLGVVVALVAGVIAAYLLLGAEDEPQSASAGMSQMEPVSGPELPLISGYAEGEVIAYIQTEASAATVADMRTAMLGSPVLLVPSLADVPESMLANVYAFANGLEGNGPFGFQVDVFDTTPSMDGYRPLRRLNKVTWVNADEARELTSAADVLEAETNGELTIEQPGIVINLPMVSWPGGER